MKNKLKKANPRPDFIALEYDILKKWDKIIGELNG